MQTHRNAKLGLSGRFALVQAVTAFTERALAFFAAHGITAKRLMPRQRLELHAPKKRARQFLGQLEPVLPGISERWNGRATVDFWLGYPWTKGSCSYFKVGQYTSFAGVESEPEGRCHFAGEHTSLDFQGYLNGAVVSGERAADEVLGSLGALQAA